MANAQKLISPQSIKKHASRAFPYYFYLLGVIAAVGSALLVIAAEVQDRTPTALGSSDVVTSVF